MLKQIARVQFNRAVGAVRQDPKRAGMIAVVVVTMIALSLHFVLHEPTTAPGADFNMSDNTGNGGSDSPQQSSAEVMKQWISEARQPAKRNLFALNLEDYPSDAPVNSAAAPRSGQDQKDQALWNDVAKSMASQADYKREQDLRLKNLQRSASKLKVEKIIVGPPAIAQVNGETVEEGSTVASLHVLQIATDRVTFEKDGVTIDVALSQ